MGPPPSIGLFLLILLVVVVLMMLFNIGMSVERNKCQYCFKFVAEPAKAMYLNGFALSGDSNPFMCCSSCYDRRSEGEVSVESAIIDNLKKCGEL